MLGEEVKGYIEYLHTNCSDWENIKLKWAATHTYRVEELNGKISTADYIKKYPGLQIDKGCQLAEIDTKLKYPDADGIDSWVTSYSKIVNLARQHGFRFINTH